MSCSCVGVPVVMTMVGLCVRCAGTGDEVTVVERVWATTDRGATLS